MASHGLRPGPKHSEDHKDLFLHGHLYFPSPIIILFRRVIPRPVNPVVVLGYLLCSRPIITPVLCIYRRSSAMMHRHIYSLLLPATTCPPVPGSPCSSVDACSVDCPRISSWKLCHNSAMVSYSRVMPSTSSSFLLRLLLDDMSPSNPWQKTFSFLKSMGPISAYCSYFRSQFVPFFLKE